MKTILLSLALFSALCAPCQQKRDSKIIVKPQDTTGLFNRVISILYDKGYSLSNRDEGLGFVSTTERGPDKFPSCTFTLHIRIADSVTITAQGTPLVEVYGTKMGSMNIDYRGEKGGMFKVIWSYMMEVAQAIPGQISYSK